MVSPGLWYTFAIMYASVLIETIQQAMGHSALVAYCFGIVCLVCFMTIFLYIRIKKYEGASMISGLYYSIYVLGIIAGFIEIGRAHV